MPVTDRDTWATVARQTAGALAAWSNATEDIPGDLAAAAEALSRSAQTYRRTVQPAQLGTVAISGAAMLLASAARGGREAVGQAAMMRQVLRLTQAVYAAAVADAQHRQAQLLASDTRARLERVRAGLPRLPGTTQLAASGRTATAALERPRVALDADAERALRLMEAGQANPAGEAATSPVPPPPPTSPEPPRRSGQTTGPGRSDCGQER